VEHSLYESAQAAITKQHRLEALTTHICFLTVLEVGNLRSRISLPSEPMSFLDCGCFSVLPIMAIRDGKNFSNIHS
jgi:hypothetical protein